jgi:hypothetical protein
MSLVLEDAIAWCMEPCPGPDGEMQYITVAWIDEGHRTMDVRRACLQHLPAFWPVKGRPGHQMREIHATSESFVDGEPLITYHIAEDNFKWQLLNMIADRKKRLKKGDCVLHIPIDADDDEAFIDEMTNEHPIQKKNQLGRTRWEWKTVGPNDYWDTVKYCIAIYAILRPGLIHSGRAA